MTTEGKFRINKGAIWAVAVIAVVVILQMDTMSFPITNGIAQHFSLFIQNFILKESGILKIIHQFTSTRLTVYAENARQCG